VRQVARADASAVRWSDEANRKYLLLASDCLPQAVVDEELCIPTGDCLCGQPQGDAMTRVIPIQPDGPASRLGHCAREGFQTVISVPVRLHERMVGELNLFYREPRSLSDDDRALLETMASHLAGAIEGLRAAALQRETAVAEERSFIARELHDSIAQSLAFLKIQLGLLRSATSRARTPPASTGPWANSTPASTKVSATCVNCWCTSAPAPTREDIAPALKTTLQKFEHQTGLATHLDIEGDGCRCRPTCRCRCCTWCRRPCPTCASMRRRARCGWKCSRRRSGAWRCATTAAASTPMAAGPDETHVGLRIMRERANNIGATVEVASVPGSGTCVVLKLPERLGLAACVLAAQPIRVLVVDDHTLFRRGLIALLAGDARFQVVAEAGDANEAHQRAAQVAARRDPAGQPHAGRERRRRACRASRHRRPRPGC
jgi:two-component system nitrate/nitrite sensor histidine kinase NarX